METPETTAGDAPETPPGTKTSRDGTRRGQSEGSKKTQRKGHQDTKADPVGGVVRSAFPGIEPEAGESEELAIMRWVSKNGPTEGEPEDVIRFREWLQVDVKGFLERRTRLAEKVPAVEEKPEAGTVADEGEERVLGLIEELLTKAGEES